MLKTGNEVKGRQPVTIPRWEELHYLTLNYQFWERAQIRLFGHAYTEENELSNPSFSPAAPKVSYCTTTTKKGEQKEGIELFFFQYYICLFSIFIASAAQKKCVPWILLGIGNFLILPEHGAFSHQDSWLDIFAQNESLRFSLNVDKALHGGCKFFKNVCVANWKH